VENKDLIKIVELFIQKLIKLQIITLPSHINGRLHPALGKPYFNCKEMFLINSLSQMKKSVKNYVLKLIKGIKKILNDI